MTLKIGVLLFSAHIDTHCQYNFNFENAWDEIKMYCDSAVLRGILHQCLKSSFYKHRSQMCKKHSRQSFLRPTRVGFEWNVGDKFTRRNITIYRFVCLSHEIDIKDVTLGFGGPLKVVHGPLVEKHCFSWLLLLLRCLVNHLVVFSFVKNVYFFLLINGKHLFVQ